MDCLDCHSFSASPPSSETRQSSDSPGFFTATTKRMYLLSGVHTAVAILNASSGFLKSSRTSPRELGMI